MKHRSLGFGLSACLLAAALLFGCGQPQTDPAALGAGHSPEPAGQSAVFATQSQTAVPAPPPKAQGTAAPDPLGEPLAQALGPLVAYEAGEAGTSLKSARAAASLLDWCAAAPADPAQAPEAPALEQALEQWYQALEQREQQAFLANWPDVAALCRRLLEDPAGQQPLLADAGIEADYGAFAGDLAPLEQALQALYQSKTAADAP